MNLAVKFYSQVENPQKIPGIWPAQILELHDVTSAPDSTWTVMTKDEYDAYRAEHMPTYLAWEDAEPKTIWQWVTSLFVAP